MEHYCITAVLPTPGCILYYYVRPLLAGCLDRNFFHTRPAQPTNLTSNKLVFTYWRTLSAFGFDWLCYQWHSNVTGVQGLDNTRHLLPSNQSRPSFYWLQFQSLPMYPYREDTIRAQPLEQKCRNHGKKKQKAPPQTKNIQHRLNWSFILKWLEHGKSMVFLR